MSQLTESLPCKHENKVSGMVTFFSSSSGECGSCRGGDLQGAHPVVLLPRHPVKSVSYKKNDVVLKSSSLVYASSMTR